jgi:hypothetical protein
LVLLLRVVVLFVKSLSAPFVPLDVAPLELLSDWSPVVLFVELLSD